MISPQGKRAIISLKRAGKALDAAEKAAFLFWPRDKGFTRARDTASKT
jgi:hypothetical protein